MMKTQRVNLLKLLLIIPFFISASANAQIDCNPYITEQSNGDVLFEIILPAEQAYIEVFVKRDGAQIIAQNIKSSEYDNYDGTFTYSYVASADNFTLGNELSTRFYAYEAGQPGVFTPGPHPGVWSESYIYGEGCDEVIPDSTDCHEYITSIQSVGLLFWVTYDAPQAHVEVFATRNGQQFVANNIVATEIDNYDGTYTYYYISSNNNYNYGYEVNVRFYSYEAGQPGVFTPGPHPGVWSEPFIFGTTACQIPAQTAKFAKSTELSDFEISLHPNPTSDVLNISSAATALENIQVTISDINGQLKLQSENETKIDVSTLKSGIYTVKVMYGENSQTEKLVIK